MDPHPEKSPGLGLPQPSMEQSAAGFGAHHATHGREIRPITMETAPASSQVPPMTAAAPPIAPTVTMPVMPVHDPNDPLGSTGSSVTDDSTDDLDEEWVAKAKAIVERTKNDPYAESKELSKAKADYLRVRYNKQIKVAEEQH